MFAVLSAHQKDIVLAIVVCTVFFSFGGGGMWLTGRLLLRNRMRKKNWMPLIGKVADVSINGSVGSSKSYYPIIAYQVRGQERTFMPTISFSRSNCQIGKNLAILVNPGNPDEAVVNYFSHLFFWPGIIFIFTSIFFFTAVFCIWNEFNKP